MLQARLVGELRRYTIGKHGSPWSPDKARTEALRLWGLVADGTDPAGAKDKAKWDLRMAQLCDLYLAEGCDKKKASTLKVERGLIERYIRPLLGKRRLKSLVRGDIERFMADIAAGKTATDVGTGKRDRAIVRGGEGASNRTTALLASMLTFAVDRRLRMDNPASGVKKCR